MRGTAGRERTQQPDPDVTAAAAADKERPAGPSGSPLPARRPTALCKATPPVTTGKKATRSTAV